MMSGCTKKAAEVSFSADVKPIISANCISCHTDGGAGTEKSGLNMTSYAALMKGTKFGPIIVPGESISSTLVRLIDGLADPSINMPHGDAKNLSADEITTIKALIDQGAKNN